ncbi:DUF1850 domain-containing protein [Heliorestis acidaminivorans]|uniref:DUF1850 domain-containing protein n=1 Tax=Heliorestis acidaminivorans TaxID=553427 RepID=A0A6I0F3F7_9FIRM|nr:DUF1850 domain-containing protein [Heliorestis acidaminivorans]KAB2952971.1 DUF1850 domain-containing protein [Heliorestis acidaminivorans]
MKNLLSSKGKKKALLLGSAFFCAFAFSLILLGFFYPSTQLYLVIEDKEQSSLLYSTAIEKGDWFSHRYIHSVEKSEVFEKFMIDEEGHIMTMESWTSSFGAGLPHLSKGKSALIDGYYVLQDLQEPVSSLYLLPDHSFPHHFFVAEEEILLSAPPYVGRVIQIDVRSFSFWHYKLLPFLGKSSKSFTTRA